MRPCRFILTVAILGAAGACNYSPTEARIPRGLARDGGLGLGSGHNRTTDGTTTTAAVGTATVAGDSLGRNGLGLGSGH